MKRTIQDDTIDWIKMVLSGELPVETPRERTERIAKPETPNARFIREALGEPAPLVSPHLRNRALVVLLEAEQDRRRALKQEAD